METGNVCVWSQIRFQLIPAHGNSTSMTHRQIQFQHGGGHSSMTPPTAPFHAIPSISIPSSIRQMESYFNEFPRIEVSYPEIKRVTGTAIPLNH